MKPLCPLCKSHSEPVFSKSGYEILECTGCHHRFCPIPESRQQGHIENHYGDEYFHGGGAGYANYLEEGRLLRNHGRRYAKILARKMKPGTVLDIGSAAGFFLQGILDHDWKGKGIEPNGTMAAFARRELGVHVDEGSFESFQTEERFDLITMVQVIAHFLDPLAAVKKASLLLKPNGYLLVETWNRKSWTARAFGKKWHEYSPPTVLQWFDPEGLKFMAEAAKMHLVDQGRPTKWLDGAHAKSLIKYVLRDSRARFSQPVLKIIPDGLPIPYPSEDLVWKLFQCNHTVRPV